MMCLMATMAGENTYRKRKKYARESIDSTRKVKRIEMHRPIPMKSPIMVGHFLILERLIVTLNIEKYANIPKMLFRNKSNDHIPGFGVKTSFGFTISSGRWKSVSEIPIKLKIPQ